MSRTVMNDTDCADCLCRVCARNSDNDSHNHLIDHATCHCDCEIGKSLVTETTDDCADFLPDEDIEIGEQKDGEPTLEQVITYCQKRCLQLVSYDLYRAMVSCYDRAPNRGEWIWDDKRCIYVCSACGTPKARENMDRQVIKEQTYCYSCGSKMEAQE